MSHVFYICIKDAEGFDRKQGWALAESEEKVRQLVGGLNGLQVMAKHRDTIWPGRAEEDLSWAS